MNETNEISAVEMVVIHEVDDAIKRSMKKIVSKIQIEKIMVTRALLQK